jgi:hypothetical protein
VISIFFYLSLALTPLFTFRYMLVPVLFLYLSLSAYMYVTVCTSFVAGLLIGRVCQEDISAGRLRAGRWIHVSAVLGSQRVH